MEELPLAEITSCTTGEEALRHLRKHHYDLLATALVLPDIDGLALCRMSRQIASCHDLPVVVSGDTDRRLLRDGLEAGVTGYFDKSNGYKAFGRFVSVFIQRNAGMVRHILFVEDSETSALVTNAMLEKYGFRVLRVKTAEDAISHLTTDKTDTRMPFDLVITDFFLQGKMNGGDLLYAIRVTLHLSQQVLPVLVLTSNTDEQTRTAVFHAGANGFASKPIMEEELLTHVRSLLPKHGHNTLGQDQP